MSLDGALTLCYKFAENKDLRPYANLGPVLSIVRATIGTYYDSSGILQTASSGVARFDHNPATGASLGLLVEEARTNICLQSEDFTTTWVEGGNSLTIVGNESVAPDGNTTADKIIDDSSTGTGNVFAFQNLTFAINTVFTASIYAEKDGLNWAYIKIASLGALVINQSYDLINGVVGTASAGVSGSAIEDVGNGWFRCSLTFTSDAADTAGSFQIFAADGDSDVTVDLDGTSSIFVWGAQLEVGNFPTSYIPTTTIEVTRDKEKIQTTDLSWLNTTVGTMFAEFTAGWIAPEPNDSRRVWTLSDQSADNRITMFENIDLGVFDTQVNITDATVAQGTTVDDTNYGDKQNVKHAYAWATNDLAAVTNGRTAIVDATASIPTGFTEFGVGQSATDIKQLNGHIAEIRYYNERKNNQFLEDLSNGLISEFAPRHGGMLRTHANVRLG
ncbi:MAG: hypothetical protein E4H27_04940 [Anaerolineales bacterium]|nr:MAG: hypothetical protein E4H27_04940 [Anaerolineales bacterium]